MHGIFLNYTYLGAGAGAQGGGAETKLGAAPTRWQYAEVVEESLRPAALGSGSCLQINFFEAGF